MSGRIQSVSPYLKLFSRAPFIALLALASVLVAYDTSGGMKDFKNRFEGTTIEPHGSEDLTLLGIHRTFEQFQGDVNLRVRFYLPKMAMKGMNPPPTRKVSIEAREIIDMHHYFMQSKPWQWIGGDWNDFTPWGTKDVITPLGLDSSNVAVLASYQDGSASRVYLPVDVLSRESPTARNTYTFYFETSWDLHSLEKSISEPSGHTAILKTDECKISPGCVLYPATSSNALEIDMSRFPEGIYTIHLVGHVPGNSTKPALPIQIYHRPD